ncbi:MAG: DnaJ domain-containing protein [Verrucomicrobia bacterium]|nr:DnaJ domain-containing protein [Verrucomicrobiota bacterium]
MTDYFALLDQPRRPWLDQEQLEAKYHELARDTHPDATPSSSGFAEVAAAYRTLRDPKLRLQHLLTLEGKVPASASSDIPPDLVELFMEIVPAIKSRNQNAITLLSGRIEHAFNKANDELWNVDQRWSSDPAVQQQADALYHRFSFLTRWRDILNEAALTMNPPG